MGVPKRKGAEGAAGAAKAKRARAEELTGVRFKTQLRDAQGPGPGERGGATGAGRAGRAGGLSSASGADSRRPGGQETGARAAAPGLGTASRPRLSARSLRHPRQPPAPVTCGDSEFPSGTREAALDDPLESSVLSAK